MVPPEQRTSAVDQPPAPRELRRALRRGERLLLWTRCTLGGSAGTLVLTSDRLRFVSDAGLTGSVEQRAVQARTVTLAGGTLGRRTARAELEFGQLDPVMAREIAATLAPELAAGDKPTLSRSAARRSEIRRRYIRSLSVPKHRSSEEPANVPAAPRSPRRRVGPLGVLLGLLGVVQLSLRLVVRLFALFIILVVIVAAALGSHSSSSKHAAPSVDPVVAQCEALSFATLALCKSEFTLAANEYGSGPSGGFTTAEIVRTMPHLFARCERHATPYECGRQLGQAIVLANRP